MPMFIHNTYVCVLLFPKTSFLFYTQHMQTREIWTKLKTSSGLFDNMKRNSVQDKQ